MTPWPPTNLFVSLPYHERLVRTMLEYDLIGFQTRTWLESFLPYCGKELGAEVDDETGRIEFEGRVTHARAYPINMLTGPHREIINDKIGETAFAATW